MKDNLFRSPVISVRADTPIGVCIRRMRDRNVGSILVTQDAAEDSPIGIFTERDVLKNIDLIQHGGYWDKPVRLVMSKPLITLDIEHLDRAAIVMLQRNIRHLPVVQYEIHPDHSEKKIRLIGVIGMRDLLVNAAKREEKIIENFISETYRDLTSPPQIALIAKGDTIQKILSDGFASIGGKKPIVERVELTEGAGDAVMISKPQLLIFDLDGQDPKLWTEFLRDWLKKNSNIRVVIVYRPIEFKPELKAALDQIKKSEMFSVFEKPIDLLQFLIQLSPWLLKRG